MTCSRTSKKSCGFPDSDCTGTDKQNQQLIRRKIQVKMEEFHYAIGYVQNEKV